MITRQQAERIAGSVNALRPEWPIPSLVSYIEQHLTSRSYLDVATAFAYIAAEQTETGSWASATPGRIREAGPWWNVGVTNPTDIAVREQAALARVARLDAIRARNQAAKNCPHCDPHGYQGGRICHHERDQDAVNQRGAELARAQIRPVKVFDSERTGDHQ